ncbi:MAG: 4-alpha-glucanotransferase [Candidatus Brocadiia bacterium]
MRLPRCAGLLLHPTSLPGRFGIGDLGEWPRRLVDFLVAAGQSLWQVLPLGPTGFGDSPYASFSARAGNALLLDLGRLAEEGDLEGGELESPPPFPDDHVDYGRVIDFKTALIARAAQRFRERAGGERRAEFDRFCAAHAAWLDDYALFRALKEAHGGAPWSQWEWELASRQPQALQAWRQRLDEAVFRHRYAQFQFFRQWADVRSYANARGIRLVGDLPIFVAYDSAEVWAHPELFHLDERLQPTVVAGVPPDYFSPTGQLWGNPLYRWDAMAERGYAWWVDRVRQTLRTVDLLRLDHFRGFAAYWEIPAGETTAENGRWMKGPGAAFFEALEEALGELPLIAEDLGLITPDVEALRRRFDLPGMAVLQFAFATDATNTYLPHNLEPDRLVYTGTHDNDTTVGWHASLSREERDHVRRYLGPVDEPVHWALIRTAYRSVAGVAMAPLQDLLGLGSEGRMNAPGEPRGNWSWRFRPDDLRPELAEKLRDLAVTYGRKEVERKEGRDEQAEALDYPFADDLP